MRSESCRVSGGGRHSAQIDYMRRGQNAEGEGIGDPEEARWRQLLVGEDETVL